MSDQTIELSEAQKIIEQDKRLRELKFKDELEELCKKYNCYLVQGQILIISK